MRAKVVLGLGFGDEGKGITVDTLCAKAKDPIVVRFSGGQQAGHTVIVINEKGEKVKHVHSSFGSGTLRGVPTYISKYCTVCPTSILIERDILLRKGVKPHLSISPFAMVTTPYNIIYNIIRSKELGHRTVAKGVGTTMMRNLGPHKFYAMDLIAPPNIIKERLASVRDYYVENYNINFDLYSEDFSNKIDDFLNAIRDINWKIEAISSITDFEDIIFEGSQGILLDMDHGFFPNVTYANTTGKNAYEICNEIGINEIDIYYVTRAYQTRHGNGFMTNERYLDLVNNEEEININNEWQGKFRMGDIDFDLMDHALLIDSFYIDTLVKHSWSRNLIITCIDQVKDFKFIPLDTKFMFKSINYFSSPVTGTKVVV